MALTFDPKTKLFQADYQAPFGGLDSTAFATAINPQNFADMDSIYIEDNQILPVDLVLLGTKTGLTGHYLGFIPLIGQTTFGYIITDSDYYQVSLVGGVFSVIHAGSYTPASTGDNSNFHYIVIDKVQTAGPIMYWTAGGWHEIWTAPTFTLTNPTLLTNYVGGGILALLNNQLLNLGGVSNLDGNVPNRISWSAPGQYGQFQPYDIPTATGNFAAGFNDLPSVSDVITGYAAIGTVGYISRTEGITQMNPTGVSSPPFQFNHLWESEMGVGTPYPGTLTQFGSFMAFVTDGAINTFGLSGLSEIGGQARTYIFKRMNQLFIGANPAPQPQAKLVPYMLNSPELTYLLAVPTQMGTTTWQYFAIDVVTGATYNLGQPVALSGPTKHVQLSYISNAVFLIANSFTRQINPLVITSTPGGSDCSFYTFKTDGTKVGTIKFRKEQLKLQYVPTVTKVILLGALIDPTQNGNVSISVDGGATFNGAFPDIPITAGSGLAGNGFVDNLISDGVQSLERPQLQLSLTNVYIVEAWYQGTLADYEVI